MKYSADGRVSYISEWIAIGTLPLLVAWLKCYRKCLQFSHVIPFHVISIPCYVCSSASRQRLTTVVNIDESSIRMNTFPSLHLLHNVCFIVCIVSSSLRSISPKVLIFIGWSMEINPVIYGDGDCRNMYTLFEIWFGLVRYVWSLPPH